VHEVINGWLHAQKLKLPLYAVTHQL